MKPEFMRCKLTALNGEWPFVEFIVLILELFLLCSAISHTWAVIYLVCSLPLSDHPWVTDFGFGFRFALMDILQPFHSLYLILTKLIVKFNDVLYQSASNDGV